LLCVNINDYDKSELGRSFGMKENIVQKLTSKDDKYACGMMWGDK
jgi:hypothetical protein